MRTSLVKFDSRQNSLTSAGAALTLALSRLLATSAELDPSKLPAPAKTQVEFGRDIKPILDSSCLRCHGQERPKSHFRLDNRESALKGGDNGVDILPGDSAKSPLVHYVARLVPDMEMPPPGKGEPLTAEQVGLVRAWIDQGANWGATNVPAQLAFSVAPTLRWVGVSGDKTKFRELEGIQEGFGGGLEQFSLEQKKGPDKSVRIEGRVLFPEEDIQVKLSLQKADVGFVRAGIEQWRRYYDDTGGFYRPFAVPEFDLDRDLHLNMGRAWADFGLTLPYWPQIVMGYEYQFKEGAKSLLEWGNVGGKNIYPSAKNINEHVHMAKLNVTHDFSGWHLEETARVEWYTQRTSREDSYSFSFGPRPDSLVRTHEEASHIQGANTIRVERQVLDAWLLTAGYLYSRFDGDAFLQQTTVDALGVPTVGQFWSSDVTVLKREAHIFSLANLVQPVEGLSLSAGVQGEWQRQEGAGAILLNADPIDPSLPESFNLSPGTIQSDLDKSKVMQEAGVRFTRIPFTVLFGEARFEQEEIGQFEEEEISTTGRPLAFLRDTDASNAYRDGRLGFNISPSRWVTLSAHYRNRLSDTDYNNRSDFTISDLASHLLSLNPGYSAFIRHRKLDTDEVQAKLVWHPISWLRTTLTYQLVATDYSTTTDPVPDGAVVESLLSGNHDAHVYGLGVILTPFQRLYFSGNFTYSDSRIITLQAAPVVPYEGNIYGVTASANYALNPATDLHCTYSFSQADYGQNNDPSGLPLGLTYSRHGLMAGISRRLTSYLSSNLRYGFYRYSEPSSGGFNDYIAHGVFATFLVKWP